MFEADPTRVSDLSLRAALKLIKPAALSQPVKVPTPKKKGPTSFDALGWWGSATLDQRRHFLDGIGLNSWLEALLDTQRAKLMRRVAENNATPIVGELPAPPPDTGLIDDPKKAGIPPFLQVQNRPSFKRQDMPLTGKAAQRAIAAQTPSADELAELNALEAKIRDIQNANLKRKPCEFKKLKRLREQHVVLAKRLGVYRLPAFEGDGIRP